MPAPIVTKVRAFLGLIEYYRRFVPNFSESAKLPNNIPGKEQPWIWSAAQQAAFMQLKICLLIPLIWKRPECGEPCILQTDRCPNAIAVDLCQVFEDREHPICYASRSLTSAERTDSATEGECLAVVWAVKHFRPYLHGRPFTLQTDHMALKWLMDTKGLTGKPWSVKLQDFDLIPSISQRPNMAMWMH